MIHDPAALVITVGGVLGALAVIWATLRRMVRGFVDVVDLVRELLQLQPRVVELGERLANLVDQMRGWHDTHEQRLTRVERAVFPNERENSHAS